MMLFIFFFFKCPDWMNNWLRFLSHKIRNKTFQCQCENLDNSYDLKTPHAAGEWSPIMHEAFCLSWLWPACHEPESERATHRAVGAGGRWWWTGGFGAALSAVVVLHPLPQQLLQALDVVDGVSQDLHFGKSLAGIGWGAAPQSLECVVHLLQPASLAHGGGSPAVHAARFTLAGFTGPLQAAPGLMEAPGGPDVLVLVWFQLYGGVKHQRGVMTWSPGVHVSGGEKRGMWEDSAPYGRLL